MVGAVLGPKPKLCYFFAIYSQDEIKQRENCVALQAFQKSNPLFEVLPVEKNIVWQVLKFKSTFRDDKERALARMEWI